MYCVSPNSYPGWLYVQPCNHPDSIYLYTQSELDAVTPPPATPTTQTITVQPVPIDPGRVADMQALFLAFLVVLVSVWGLKQLLRLFTTDTERD